jgi:hypothetical protein
LHPYKETITTDDRNNMKSDDLQTRQQHVASYESVIVCSPIKYSSADDGV